MEFNENTRLIEILNAYPGLEPKIREMDPRLNIISTPMGKMLLKKKTVADASQLSGIPVPVLLEKLDEMIRGL